MSSAISRLAICATTPIVACALLAFAPAAGAAGVQPAAPASGQTTVRDGLSAATAAASCWDIKQHDSSSADGAYWLQTPAMEHPAQFYCDQTTDGGGWVLIGRGREGWEGWSGGKGDPSKLTTRERNASAFDVVQYSNDTINQLLNNESVKDQSDGVRVLRAWSTNGSSYQKLAGTSAGAMGWMQRDGAAMSPPLHPSSVRAARPSSRMRRPTFVPASPRTPRPSLVFLTKA